MKKLVSALKLFIINVVAEPGPFCSTLIIILAHIQPYNSSFTHHDAAKLAKKNSILAQQTGVEAPYRSYRHLLNSCMEPSNPHAFDSVAEMGLCKIPNHSFYWMALASFHSSSQEAKHNPMSM